MVQDEINIQESSVHQKSNNTMSVILCTRATSVKKNSCLVVRIVLLNSLGLHLLALRILETHLYKDIELVLSHVISH